MRGSRLGPYRLLGELGSGGMGRVFRAEVVEPSAGLEAGSTVALKTIHPHLLSEPRFVERFRREAEVGQQVHHENVVRTLGLDAAEVGGRVLHFLVLEYVEGQTLGDLQEELGCVPEELCRHIAREVTKGLAAIHAVGVIHRDVKPENVLITADHVVKVMDLGVALLGEEMTRLSRTGGFVGSIQYTAPECLADPAGGIDGRADLHALGVVLYELASGTHPFQADGAPGAIRRILHDRPRPLGDLNPQLSPFFEEIVHALLEKKPDDRFPRAEALLAAMEAGEEGAWWHDRARAVQAATRRPIRRIRIPRETGVHGRETELATLQRLYEEVREGDGRSVVIEGEAGIGKSRLVDELIGRLQRDGEDCHFLFGDYPPYGAAMAAGAFAAAFHAQFGEAGSEAWLARCPSLVPAFDALLRGDIPPERHPPLTTDALHTCFVHATRSLAADRPTILLIEDLHFASEEGYALFNALALAVRSHRILLIGTVRRGGDPSWLVELDRLGATRITLDRLGPRDLVALLIEALGSEHLAEEIAAKVALKSDGNPFFVFEILRGLRESQRITRSDDGSWMTTRAIGELEIPSSVLDLVNARVADLDAEDRDLLDLAACSGYEFDPVLLADATGASRIPVLKRLAQIERRRRLVRAAGPHYVFDHHQVQEALYAAISEPLRREYHAAIGDALERRTRAAEGESEALDGALATQLCEHLLRGTEGGRALPYLRRAQRHLEHTYANARAVHLAERALALPELETDGAARVDALLGLSATLERLGRRERQEAVAAEALVRAEALGDDVRRGRAAGAVGLLRLRTWRLEEARESLQTAFDLARALGDRSAEEKAAGHLGGLAYYEGRHEDAEAHHRHALALARENEDADGEATALGNLGVLLFEHGRLDEARRNFERQRVLSEKLGDADGRATAETNLGGVCYLRGKLSEAEAHYERALTLSREVGHRESEAIGIGNLANLLMARGSLVRARDQYVKALTLAREIGGTSIEVGVLVNLGPLWLALGDRTRARETLEDALALARKIGARSMEGYALDNLGQVAAAEGDPAEAMRITEASLVVRREIDHAEGVVDSLIEIAALRRHGGDVEGARAALDEALPLAEAQGRAGPVAVAYAMAAGLPGGDAAPAIQALAACDAPHQAQRARWLLWEATGDRVHLDEAVRLLDEAVALVPEEHRAAMRVASGLNRKITAANQRIV